MPEGAVYVGRPSLWGNPFSVESAIREGFAADVHEARRVCVAAFREWVAGGSQWWMGPDSEIARSLLRNALGRLQGRDLVCWCPLDQPCHADVLLELANQ